MNPALWISKTGLDAQQTNISVTSNNLANASTVGYKKARAIFEDLLYQNVNQPGGRSSADTELPSGLMLGAGAKVVATQKNHSQGNVQTTDNSLDLMISGRGYFEIQLPDGSAAYKRYMVGLENGGEQRAHFRLSFGGRDVDRDALLAADSGF